MTAVVALVVIAALLRRYHIGGQLLWLDEIGEQVAATEGGTGDACGIHSHLSNTQLRLRQPVTTLATMARNLVVGPVAQADIDVLSCAMTTTFTGACPAPS